MATQWSLYDDKWLLKLSWPAIDHKDEVVESYLTKKRNKNMCKSLWKKQRVGMDLWIVYLQIGLYPIV